MKKINLLLLIFFLGITSLFAQVNSNKVWVKSYYKSDGTYVSGHYRTAPNKTNKDNYTTKPNYNPHTGTKGTVKPDNKPNYNPHTGTKGTVKPDNKPYYKYPNKKNPSSTSAKQCYGITLKGVRCRRKTTNVNGRC